MKFTYLVGMYNESSNVHRLCQELGSRLIVDFPGSKVLLLENGSVDDTWERCLEVSRQFPWAIALRSPKKGLGNAFQLGFTWLSENGVDDDEVIVLTAADLPFGFTDLESFIGLNGPQDIAIGSKAHLESQNIKRGFKRKLASMAFQGIRRLLLGTSIGDTQGTYFMGSRCLPLLLRLQSEDYFITTEIAYLATREGLQIVEMPVTLQPDWRSSSVNVLKDGMKMLKSTWSISRNS